MEYIKNFINEFLKAEASASDAMIKPNLDDYNAKLAIMKKFVVKELENTFGMLPRTELWDNDLYEEWKNASPRNPRNIFKISHYIDKIYKDVYVAYISERNPDDEIFLYGMCLFVAYINNDLKIVKKYSFGDSLRIKDKFEAGIGLDDISFETLKKPAAIERYKEPVDDQDAMEHYLMDI
jgi:hypothetical protein